jgi:mannose-6-phosphate isomerase-like protein (cupin superfamily)
MRRTITALVVTSVIACAFPVRVVRLQAGLTANHTMTADHGSLIERDAEVAKREPGTHNGGGETTGYSFFAKTKDPALVFRKRALHPGSAIGLHTQKVDEVYYILSGTGELTLDGEKHRVSVGTAILTRPGSSHSLRQTGPDDLVMIIAYPPESQK